MNEPPEDRIADTFSWRDTAARLKEVLADDDLVAEPERGCFRSAREVGDRSPAIRFHPPRVLPITADRLDPERYLSSLDPLGLGRQVVVLIQAGSSAVGLWDETDLILHKVIRAYVVRGKGRAQMSHLKTKGKSRYGSRLRLQNWERQRVETNQRLLDWRTESGPFDVVHVSCPVRLWPDFYAADPPPPFPRDEALRIPIHVHRPDFNELVRVRRRLEWGRIERPH